MKNEEVTKKNSKNGWLIFGAIIVVVGIWCANLYFYFSLEKNQGQLGDVFGASNALFSGLALAGIVLTLYMQRHEIKIQHNELDLQREELKNTRGVFEEQSILMTKQQNDNTFFNLLQNYRELVESFKIGNERSFYSKPNWKKTGESKEEISGYKVIENIANGWRRTIESLKSQYNSTILTNQDIAEHPFINIENNHITKILSENITNILEFIDTRFESKDKGFYNKIVTNSLSVNEIYVYEVLANNGILKNSTYKNFFGEYDSYDYSDVASIEIPKYNFSNLRGSMDLEILNKGEIVNCYLSDLKTKIDMNVLISDNGKKINIEYDSIVDILTDETRVFNRENQYMLFTIELNNKKYYLPLEFELTPSGNSPKDFTYSMHHHNTIFNSEKTNQLINI